MTCVSSCYDIVGVLSLDDEFLKCGVYLTLLGSKEACAYLNALCAQHEGCCHTSAVSDTACGDNGYLNRVNYLRHKTHCGVFTDMSARLGTLCDDRIGARLLHSLCKSYRGNNGHHLYACFLPCSHVLAGIARTCGDDLNALVDTELCKVVGIGAHEHDVHAEGLVGLLLAETYLLTKIVDGSASACDKTYTACV